MASTTKQVLDVTHQPWFARALKIRTTIEGEVVVIGEPDQAVVGSKQLKDQVGSDSIEFVPVNLSEDASKLCKEPRQALCAEPQDKQEGQNVTAEQQAAFTYSVREFPSLLDKKKRKHLSQSTMNFRTALLRKREKKEKEIRRETNELPEYHGRDEKGWVVLKLPSPMVRRKFPEMREKISATNLNEQEEEEKEKEKNDGEISDAEQDIVVAQMDDGSIDGESFLDKFKDSTRLVNVVAQMDEGGESTEQIGNIKMKESPIEVDETAIPGRFERPMEDVSGVSTPPSEAELFARWQHLARFYWKAGETKWSILDFDIVKQLQVSSHYFPRVLSYHAYFKCEMRFRLQVNTNRFQIGRLALVWIPPSKESALAEARSCVEMFTTFPHVVFDAASALPVILRIPYAQVANFITTLASRNTGRVGLGMLMIVQLTGLHVPEDSRPSVDGTVWVSVVNAALKVPTASHTLFSTKVVAQGEIAEQIAGAAGKIAATTVPKLVRAGLAAIPIIGPLLDQPINYQSMRERRRPALGPLSIVDGPDEAVRLSMHMYRDPQVRTTGQFDELHASYLCGLNSVVLVVNPDWMTGVGDQHFILPVHPRLCAPPKTNDDKSEMVQAGFLHYVSSMFAYWRGSLKFHIEVITSYFTTGRLAFTWVPEIDLNWTFSRDDLDSILAFPTVVLDIGESREVTFVVPYITDTPVKMIPSIVHGKDYHFIYANRFCNGVLVAHVINAIVAPPSVPQFMTVWVGLSGGEDFELMVPAGPFDPIVNTEVAQYKPAEHGISTVRPRMNPASRSGKISPVEFNEIDGSKHTKRRRYFNKLQQSGHLAQTSVPEHARAKGLHAQADDPGTLGRGVLFGRNVPPMEVARLRVPSIFGEDFMDLRSLLKRRMLMAAYQIGTAITTKEVGHWVLNVPISPMTNMGLSNQSRSVPQLGWILVAQESGNDYLGFGSVQVNFEPVCAETGVGKGLDTFLSMISRLFTFYSGSLRYSLLISQGVGVHNYLSAEFVPGVVYNLEISGGEAYSVESAMEWSHWEPRGNYAVAIDNASVRPAVEVEVPIQGMYDQLFVTPPFARYSPGNLQGSPGMLQFTYAHACATTNLVGRLYVGGGNDFSLHLPAFAPAFPRFLKCAPGGTSSIEDDVYFIDCKGVQAQALVDYLPEWNTSWKMASGVAVVAIVGTICYKQAKRGVLHALRDVADELRPTNHAIRDAAMGLGRAAGNTNAAVNDARGFANAIGAVIEDATQEMRGTMQTVRLGVHSMSDSFERVVHMAHGLLSEVVGPEILGLMASRDLTTLAFLVYDAARIRDALDIGVMIAKIAVALPGLGVTLSTAHFFSTMAGAWRPQVVAQADWNVVHGLMDVIMETSGKNATAGVLLIVAVLVIAKQAGERNGRPIEKELSKPATTIAAGMISKDLLMAFKDFGLISSSFFAISRGIPILLNLMEKFICHVQGIQTEEEKNLMILRSTSEDVLEWATQVVRLNQDSVRIRMAHDAALQREVKDLHNKGMDLFQAAVRAGVEAGVSHAFSRMLMVSKELEQIATRCSDNLGYRREPFCFTLYGQPGVGKTTIVQLLARKLGELEGYGSNQDSYSRSSEDDYWSNYAQQHTVIYDDFPKSNTPDAMKVLYEFINVKSSNPYPVTMAAVDDKGMMMKSRILAVTTNSPYFTPQAMLEENAFKRRRDMVVRVQSVGSVDDGFTFSNQRFQEMDRFEERSVGAEMTYEELGIEMKARFTAWCVKEARRLCAIGVPGDRVLDEFSGAMREIVAAEIDIPVVAQMGREDLNPGRSAEPSGSRSIVPLLNRRMADSRVFSIDSSSEDDEILDYRYHPSPRGTRLAYRMNLPRNVLRQLRERFTPREWARMEIAIRRRDVLNELIAGDQRVALLVSDGRERGLTPEQAIEQAIHDSAYMQLRHTVETMTDRFGGPIERIRQFAQRQSCCRWLLLSMAVLPVGMVMWYMTRDRAPRNEDVEHGNEEDSVDEGTSNRARPDREQVWCEPGAKSQAEVVVESQTGDRHLGEYGKARKLGKPGKTHTKTKKAAAFKKRGGFHAQGTIDEDKNLKDMQRRVREKCVVEAMVYTNGVRRKMLGIGIGGRVALFPAHYFVLLNMDGVDHDITLMVGQRTTTVQYSELDVRFYGEENDAVVDLAVVMVPPSVGAFPSIANYFMSEHEMDENRHAQMLVDIWGKEKSFPSRTISGAASLMRYSDNKLMRYPVSSEVSDQSMVLTDAWFYEQVTSAGDCGAPLYVVNPIKSTGRIAGMHVAGNANTHRPNAYAICVSKEIVEAALETFEEDLPEASVPLEELELEVKPTEGIVAQGSLVVHGRIDKGVNVPRDTNFLRTEIWDENLFPHTKDLSVLKDNDPRMDKKRDVLWEAVQKYGVGSKGMTTDEFRDLREYYRNVFLRELKKPDRTILNYEEALFSHPELENVQGMDPRTSLGYPYVQQGLKKKDIMDAAREGRPSPVSIAFEKRLQRAKEGLTSSTIWMDILKDEKRKLTKIKQGKTRAFTVGPADFNLLVRAYFLPFMDAMMGARHRMWSQIGIDPESVDWHLMVQQLVAFGGNKNFLDGDYENFDGRLHAMLWWLFGRCVDDWANDTGTKVRAVVVVQASTRYSIAKNIVLEALFGNPSGIALTSGFNCFANATIFRLAWYRYTYNSTGLKSVASFDNYFLDKNYGDDAKSSTRNITARDFTRWLSEIEKMGHVFTDGGKTGSPKLVALEETTFLKRASIKCPIDNCYYGALDWDSIYGMLHFVRKGMPRAEALADNVLGACRSAFFHGPEAYDTFVGKLRCFSKFEEYKIYAPSYAEMAMIIFYSRGVTPDVPSLKEASGKVSAQAQLMDQMQLRKQATQFKDENELRGARRGWMIGQWMVKNRDNAEYVMQHAKRIGELVVNVDQSKIEEMGAKGIADHLDKILAEDLNEDDLT